MAKRPRDPNQLAKQIVEIATGEVEDTVSDARRHPESVRGRLGGLSGGAGRARKLSAKRRLEIAKKAAATRWNKPDPL